MQAVQREVSPSLLCSFSGSAEELCNRLSAMEDRQAFVVVLEAASEYEAKSIEQVVVQIMDLTEESFSTLSTTALSRLVEILLPKQSPSPALLMEAKMLLHAKRAVIEGADWLTAAQVAGIAGLSQNNSISQVRKWKRDGAIFAIHHSGVDYFPGYVLDPENEYRPYRALRKVIAHFQWPAEGWGLAFWFQSVNSFLGGKRPIDMFAKNSDEVVAAAADAASGVNHA